MAIDLQTDPPTCNQSDLAEMIRVDRTTVRNYTKAGLPFIAGSRGKENRYIIPLCINWVAGYQTARENGLPMMNALELILLGYTTAYRNDASSRAYYAAAAGVAELAGATPAEFEQAIGFLRGARLLPW